MPWDGAVANPIAALTQARAALGDTFAIEAPDTTYLFLFSPAGVQAFYAVEESVASKGIADWQMLRRKLPDEYWVRRLENTSGFYHALEVAEQNGGAALIPKLNEVFEKLRQQGKTPPAAGSWAASTAAALFRQTGDARYREYLEEQARRQLADPSFEQNLPKVLEGLAASGDRGAFDLVSSALGHENGVIRTMAIDALSKSRNPTACDLLFETAIERTKGGKGFPGWELRALVIQGSPDADFKYERLKQALLNGQLGWNAVISDFDVCEFLRKHGIHHSSYH